MREPNWFDRQYGSTLAEATAEQALQIVAADATVIAVVRSALNLYDATPNHPGPGRTQVIVDAVVRVLQQP